MCQEGDCEFSWLEGVEESRIDLLLVLDGDF